MQWYDLGIQLLDDKGSTGVLDAIKADHPNDVNACCNKMFIKWLLMKPDATWSQLVTALTGIGMNTVAADLNKQLRKGSTCTPWLFVHNVYCREVCIGDHTHLSTILIPMSMIIL